MNALHSRIPTEDLRAPQSLISIVLCWLRNSVNDILLRPLAATVFAAIYVWLLFPIARFYWFVPAGLRFAALALLPRRYWLWILGGEFYARIFVAVVAWNQGNSLMDLLWCVAGPAALAIIFFAPLASVPGSMLMRWRSSSGAMANMLSTPGGMGWMLFACLICAAGETIANLLIVYVINIENPGMGIVRFTLGKLTGDYMGVIALAPALFAILLARDSSRAYANWRKETLLLLAFAAAYVVVMRTEVDDAVYDYMRILILIPTFVFAIRHGWRAAALALALSSWLVTLLPALHAPDPYRNLFTQMLLALFGSVSLLLGAALDSQRASRNSLAAQNNQLAHANRDLDRLGIDLRDAAQRNLRLEEEQRRRMAAELHDELGQNLTAVHTRIKLAADWLNAAQLGDVTTSIYEILATMRRSVHGLMDSLRPPALDEFGLVRALREGPLRDLVEQAGLRYVFALNGEPALIAALGEDTQIAVWRIVQEGATNAVRHAQGTHFDARLRIGIRGKILLLVINLRDDGVGITTTPDARRGYGLQGMRDRALALDGKIHIASNGDGTRLHVLLRQTL